MVENDIFTSKAQLISNSQAKSAVNSLITPERLQKLDLLVHLITNLRQSLIVSGPAGIGKTTFLKVLIERSSPDWHCCCIQGGHALSFESILEQLDCFIKKDKLEIKSHNLTGFFTHLCQRNQKLVLIIDEAGLLVPGLIDTLNQYSLANLPLRLIYALTQDELYVKNSSDRTVEDCHVIELPPLTEKQCGEFLQNLSGKPGAPISFSAINDNMVAHLYQETHGIPGRIMMELPHLSEYGQTRQVKWIPVVSAILAALAAVVYWAYENEATAPATAVKPISNIGPTITRVEPMPPKIRQNNRPSIITEPENEVEDAKKDAAATVSGINTAKVITDKSKQLPSEAVVMAVNGDETGPVQVAPSVEEATTVGVASVSAEPEQKPDEGGVSSEKALDAEPNSTDGIESPLLPAELSSALKPDELIESEQKKLAFETDDKQWLFKQPSKNYTLQLIALSNRQSLMTLMNKYSSLKSQFKYIRTVSKQKEKYVLLYGSFNSYASAGSVMQTLPKEFRKAWIRRFKVLQKDVKNEN